MNQSILSYIGGWYICSISLSLYNKWMFDPKLGLSVPYPILVTSLHQCLLWAIAWTYLRMKKSNRPVDQSINHQTWKFYLKFIIPTALASAGDIGLGNVSFKFIALAIYTIVKSSSIAFVLLFGCIFKTEKFHWRLMVIVLVMFLGVLMMIYKPDMAAQKPDGNHEVLGVLLVLGSSALSGLRWVYTQLILQRGETNSPREPDKKTPIDTIYQLAPVMGFTLLITSLIVERPFPGIFHSHLFQINDSVSIGSVLRGVVLIGVPGVLVFLMTICEFGILQRAHVLTLSVAGVVKELLTIAASMLILREKLTGLNNWLGMFIILLDVSYYNVYRYNERRETAMPLNDQESDEFIQEFELETNKQRASTTST
ncbi:LANO_0H11738g1_1 [Lachancea nothofagi CBS 11611]|uniref:LANO_0H11738g1_1 n=1 Tax=Lachancea nothofagi CBS 11611 TaxID=1266666 RepID=A0A1G4KMA6_9SACH|nr:LANO_0H11738g1_1 [Lachancea nothofagi CBS 11611]